MGVARYFIAFIFRYVGQFSGMGRANPFSCVVPQRGKIRDFDKDFQDTQGSNFLSTYLDN